MNIIALINKMNSMGIEFHIMDKQLQCQAAKGVLTKDLVALIKEKKEDIINYLNHRYQIIHDHTYIDPKETIKAPLSFVQEHQWHLTNDLPNAAFNIPIGFIIYGKFNVAAFQCAFDQIFARHEILRTRFVKENDLPVQLIFPSSQTKISFVDITNSTTDKNVLVQQLFHEEEVKIFDFVNESLLRLKIIQMNSLQHVLLLTAHQIIFDMESWKILFNELKLLYASALSHQSLPALNKQFKDFAIEERQLLLDSALQNKSCYWQNLINTLIHKRIHFPVNNANLSRWSYVGDEKFIDISETLTLSMKVIASRYKVTMSMLFLAIYSLVLYDILKMEEFIIACPLTTRHDKNADNVIGPFLNTVLVAIELSNNPSFEELLIRIKEAVLEAYSYIHISCESLFSKLPLFQNNIPLVQLMYNFQQTDKTCLELDCIEIQQIYTPTCTAKCCLTLSLKSNGVDIKGRLEYSTDIFNEREILQYYNSFNNILLRLSQNHNFNLNDFNKHI